MVGILSRIQFAVTVSFHFLFVPVSIGLIILVAIFETNYFRTNDEKWKRLSHFWSELFIIAYAFGIVTGIAMSIQFGTNWANYSVFMGDIFGSPLALEALIAFFLESTFTGIWIFRRHKISKIFRLITVYLITLGTTISAIWIITANGFMQNPVGAINVGDKMELVSFKEVILNPYAWWIFFHNHIAAILLGAFFVMSISAWGLLRGREDNKEDFKLSLKVSSWVMLVAAVITPFIGSSYMGFIAEVQPSKIAKIGGESAFVSASFGLMVALGLLFIAIGIYAAFFHKKLVNNDIMLNIITWSFPLPFIAILAGWVVTEVGRQPWIVYGQMTVDEAISQVPVEQVWFSLISIVIYYIALAVLDVHLTTNRIKKGIESSGIR